MILLRLQVMWLNTGLRIIIVNWRFRRWFRRYLTFDSHYSQAADGVRSRSLCRQEQGPILLIQSPPKPSFGFPQLVSWPMIRFQMCVLRCVWMLSGVIEC